MYRSIHARGEKYGGKAVLANLGWVDGPLVRPLMCATQREVLGRGSLTLTLRPALRVPRRRRQGSPPRRLRGWERDNGGRCEGSEWGQGKGNSQDNNDNGDGGVKATIEEIKTRAEDEATSHSHTRLQ